MDSQENKKFDDFIRKASGVSPKLPKGLEWDKMNIEIGAETNSDKAFNKTDDLFQKGLIEYPSIPNNLNLDWEEMNIPIPEKKNKRRFILLWFAGILIPILIAISYYSYKSVHTNQIINQEQILDHSDLPKPLSTKPIKNIKQPEPTSIKKTVDLAQKKDQNLGSKKRPNKSNKQKNNYPIASTSLSQSQVKPSNIIVSKRETLLPSVKVLKSSGTNKSSIKALKVPFIKNNAIPKIISIFKRDEQLDFNINDIIINNEKRTSIHQIYFQYGYNISTLSHKNNLQSPTEWTSKLGLSLAIGTRKKLSQNLSLNIGINYDEVHSVFKHSYEVERTYLTGQNAYQIVCEHLYQNNYSKYIGISAGLGVSKSITSNLKIFTDLNFNGNYLFSIKGTSLDNDQLINLEDIEKPEQWNVNISPSISINYDFSRQSSVYIMYNFRTSIFGSSYIDHQIKTHHIHVFGIGTAIKI